MGSPVYEGSLSFFGYRTVIKVVTGVSGVSTEGTFRFQASATINGMTFGSATTTFQWPGADSGGVSNRLAPVAAEDPGASERSAFREAEKARLT